MKNLLSFRKIVYCAGIALLIGGAGDSSTASTLTLSDSPLFLSLKAPPLNLLVMGRDHKLYYEAYNDASDLDGDGTLDIGYKGYVLVDDSDSTKGYKIDYFGYFDSYKCYSYASSVFTPTRTTTNKKCTVVGSEWSGDFLNYLTMSRMDVLRKVLFGGRRSTDTATLTVLERAYIPQDTHSWAKEYTGAAANQDGYDIAEYSPLSVPTSGRHLFANTTRGNSEPPGNPLLRVLQNRSERAWEWVSREVLQADNTIAGSTAVTPTDYVVRVQVCVTGLLETANCKLYGTSYKPTGLLQDNANDMKFGLITGSYTKNLSGGVLRKQIGSITDEINADGTFTSTNGIINTINKLRIRNYNGTHNTSGNSCGLIPTRPLNEGECRAWGNPIAEMMYEGLRYYAGKASPTSAFDYTNTSAGAPDDYNLDLPKVSSWTNPYGSGATQNPWCAKPTMMVISDIYPSYDTDQLPGVDSNFGSGLTGDMPASLNVGTLAQTIWDTEQGATGVTKSHFIGQVGATYDGAATAKTVGSFSNIRGLAPEEPTKKGGYYSASIAYWGHTNDVNSISGGASDLTGQKLDFYAVALSPPMPKIDIKVGTNTITLIPFAKSVAGVSINPASGQFQPTNSLARVFVESLTSTSGTFRVNFEDQEQGNDFDMDGIAQYSYTVSGSSVDITVSLVSAAGGITQHMGYVISGTTADGTYLDIRDETACGSDTNYFLDTPQHSGTCLPTTKTRTFTPGSAPAATLLKDPLWYTAKWGGFKDSDANDKPNLSSEWDAKNASGQYVADQVPDNYFYVSNPLGLSAALNSAFDSILKASGTASSVAVNTASLSTDSYVYQAIFTSSTWSGQLLAKKIDPVTGVVAATATWDSGLKLESQNWDTGRTVLTWNPDSAATRKGVPFRWSNIGSTNQTYLNSGSYGQERLNFLRGDNTNEAATTNPSFRARSDSNLGGHFKLGDIVNSAPIFVGAPPFLYPDTLEDPSGATKKYSSFRNAQKNRTPIIYVGANDGMLHGFNACAVTSQPGCSDATQHGKEVIAYVPAAAYPNLSALSNPNYGSSHKYFVDLSPTAGDVFGDFSATVSSCTAGCWRTLMIGGMRAGGKAYFALDITDPSAFSEATSQATNQVLWEYTHADLGNTFSDVTIAKMHTASGTRWAAIFGNGYNSTNGYASLFIVDAITGALIKKIDVDTAGSNGLSTPVVVDTDGNYIADYIYAGDLKGNMWKFDVTDNNEVQWGSYYSTGSTPKPLFKAVDGANVAQPITSRPEVGKHPDGLAGYMVYFGTGKYVEVGDNNPGATPSPTHTFYGLWDKDTNGNGGTPIVRADLLAQTITEGTFRTVTNNPIYWDGETYAGTPSFTGSHKGWRDDLLTTTAGDLGEMVVSNPILRSTRVIFTTLIPDTQQCTSGGSSWLMELNYQNGGRLAVDVFDINNDGVFNSNDRDGGATVISGVKTGIGISPTPTMIDDPAKGRELKIVTGSSGAISSVSNNPGPLTPATGRRSWRQIK